MTTPLEGPAQWTSPCRAPAARATSWRGHDHHDRQRQQQRRSPDGCGGVLGRRHREGHRDGHRRRRRQHRPVQRVGQDRHGDRQGRRPGPPRSTRSAPATHTIRVQQTLGEDVQNIDVDADYGQAAEFTTADGAQFTNGTSPSPGRAPRTPSSRSVTAGKQIDQFTVTAADGTFTRELQGLGSGTITLSMSAASRGGVTPPTPSAPSPRSRSTRSRSPPTSAVARSIPARRPSPVRRPLAPRSR